MGRPFPAAWLDILERRVSAYPRLSARDQATLLARIQVFLGEKTFVGCAGLTVTDEVRVVIAAQASRLELGRTPTYFPHCLTVYVYPSAFVSNMTETLPGGVVNEHEVVRVGESWSRGSVVLAWDETLASSLGFTSGRNVVLHEFAHQLDGWDGSVDGVPDLRDAHAYARWQQGMQDAYLALHEGLRWGRATIDPYAASSPAEFFAVTTELYFEDVDALREHAPVVPNLLADYYGVEAYGVRARQLN